MVRTRKGVIWCTRGRYRGTGTVEKKLLFVVTKIVKFWLSLYAVLNRPFIMKTIEVVAAIIRRGSQIFATQRGYGDFKDWWEFPGGKMEPGETPQEALSREILEELSAHIHVGKLLHTVEWDYPQFQHEAARWLSARDLHSVNWLPADEMLLPLIEKELSAKED